MRAVAIDSYGDAGALRVTELPDPPVGPDTVLVRVRAAGVNPVDWKVRAGHLDGLWPTRFPLVPGWDAAGVVERVGPGVTEFAPGDEVVAYARRDDLQWGTYAELVPAPVRTVAPKPRSVDFETAAGLPLVGLTAHQALDAAGVGEGDTVLVHAAAGGVGHVAVQLAAARGARVVGTASERNHEHLRSLGAEPVAYGEGLVERVRELAPAGVDAALDLVGGEALDASAELVADRARIVSVVDAARVRELGGRYVFVRPDAAALARLSELVDDGTLRLDLHRALPLEEAAEAHRLSEGGGVRGKVVLRVSGG